MGYILGKAEGEGEHWHGHVTAVTVRQPARSPVYPITAAGREAWSWRAAAAPLGHGAIPCRTLGWHGTQVAPDYRRQQLAQKLMHMLEEVTEKVRCSSWWRRP